MATVSHEAYLTEESEIADVSRLLDAVSLEVYGLPGFGFWDDNEVNVVIQHMLDHYIDFRILKDDTPYVSSRGTTGITINPSIASRASSV
ncbi:hypothetical protein DPMN_084972 [Dreissena polymorpha]|uniref:Uncharacterized protein n=1 Tax=Dreissena polymorpha TaxID=45954 RepID=A0A9D3YFB4_DREPO|nr:hypothetical protein DPMN_084972 [Dreissena polymorpha]